MKGFFEKTEEGNLTVPFLKALAAGYALTAVIFMILATALTYTNMSETYIPVISTAATAGACFMSGIISGKGLKKKGLLSGALSAVFYILVMLIIGIFAKSGTSLGTGSIPTIVMSLCAGAAGGILGVNL